MYTHIYVHILYMKHLIIVIIHIHIYRYFKQCAQLGANSFDCSKEKYSSYTLTECVF